MMLDLAVVVPDKAIEQAIGGLVERPKKLGIRPITCRLIVHVERDPGCFNTAHELLRPLARTVRHGLVVFDKDWDGAPLSTAAEMAADVEARLRAAWGDRARCVVIDPEVDVWLWTNSPHLCSALGLSCTPQELRAWLAEHGLWPSGSLKPNDPKAAFKRAAARGRVPPSSSVFREMAGKVAYSRCTDTSFQRVLTLLRGWFPSAKTSRRQNAR